MRADSTDPAVMQDLLECALQHSRMCTLHVSGDSMHPTIRDGEVVVVERADARTLSRGQIVVFRGLESLCMHRIVDVALQDGRPMLLTAGDGNRGADGFIDPAAVIGRVAEVCGDAGSWRPDSRGSQAALRGFLGRHGGIRRALGGFRDALRHAIASREEQA